MELGFSSNIGGWKIEIENKNNRKFRRTQSEIENLGDEKSGGEIYGTPI